MERALLPSQDVDLSQRREVRRGRRALPLALPLHHLHLSLLHLRAHLVELGGRRRPGDHHPLLGRLDGAVLLLLGGLVGRGRELPLLHHPRLLVWPLGLLQVLLEVGHVALPLPRRRPQTPLGRGLLGREHLLRRYLLLHLLLLVLLAFLVLAVLQLLALALLLLALHLLPLLHALLLLLVLALLELEELALLLLPLLVLLLLPLQVVLLLVLRLVLLLHRPLLRILHGAALHLDLVLRHLGRSLHHRRLLPVGVGELLGDAPGRARAAHPRDALERGLLRRAPALEHRHLLTLRGFGGGGGRGDDGVLGHLLHALLLHLEVARLLLPLLGLHLKDALLEVVALRDEVHVRLLECRDQVARLLLLGGEVAEVALLPRQLLLERRDAVLEDRAVLRGLAHAC
mmetsp:Transcript_24413/g.58182  ORF Transcript_24413/g.58182 Transcript_24413/m.58182 type:complete len:401 (+) Transcript_24413:154-1356(+)